MVTLASSGEPKREKTSSTPSQNKAEPHLHEVQWHLAQRLQTTLELKDMLNMFFDAARSFTGVDSLKYNAGADGYVHAFGEKSPHHTDYRVRSDKEDLGTISFTRSYRFAEAELAVLEILIGSLFYPLRNALMYRRAKERSMRDPLTGVGNRTALHQTVNRELELAKRYRRDLCLMLIDIDHFKKINDTVGHSVGDEVLKHLVEMIAGSLRQVDEIFRYGGEEFVVILSNTQRDCAGIVGERIRRSVAAEPLELDGGPVSLTVSIGYSSWREGDTEKELFDRADGALYRAKHAGRNRVLHEDQ